MEGILKVMSKTKVMINIMTNPKLSVTGVIIMVTIVPNVVPSCPRILKRGRNQIMQKMMKEKLF